MLDFGKQALCNRFLDDPASDEALFPFAMGQCRACGIAQLLAPVPAEELKPRYEWITYREAEGHLDDLVEELSRLPGVTTDSVIGAISAKDDSTVARFHRLGFPRTWRLDIERDLETDDHGAGPETVQRHLSPAKADAIARRRGPADVLLARHVLEHAQDPGAFVAALRRLVKPDGYLVIEVPDCGPAMQRGDYTMPWEEHVLYFTQDLLRQAVACWGLGPVAYKLYPYSHENSLVAVVRSASVAPRTSLDASVTEAALRAGAAYAQAFPGYRRRVHAALAECRRVHGKVALFGAGHLSCAWMNFLETGTSIDFVADDDPRKNGLYMPGSRVPILASSQLVARGVKLCLLSLNQESEAKVIAKNRAYLDGGGRFASLFPGRSNSFVAWN